MFERIKVGLWGPYLARGTFPPARFDETCCRR